MEKTTKMVATVGTIPGYNPESLPGATWERFNVAAEAAAARVSRETGIYVSVVTSPARAVYSPDWGCPLGGEPVFRVESTRNPAFAPDSGKWQAAFLKVAREIMNEFKQSTVTVDCQEVDYFYLQKEGEE